MRQTTVRIRRMVMKVAVPSAADVVGVRYSWAGVGDGTRVGVLWESFERAIAGGSARFGGASEFSTAMKQVMAATTPMKVTKPTRIAAGLIRGLPANSGS